MKSLLESIRLQVYERLSSPLFGAFVIAWFIWNHPYVLILFSSETITERLQFASQAVFPDWGAVICRGIIYPLLSSIGFILLYPYASKWVFAYWHRRQQEIKKLRDEIEGETPLTIEESRRIRSSVLETQMEYEEKFRKQAELIETLKTELQARTRKATELRSPLHPVPLPTSQGSAASLDPGAAKILKLLAEAGGSSSERAVFSTIKEPPVRMKYYVDQVKDRGLVERNYSGDDVYTLELTDKGRKHVVEAKIV